jgi:hypothetical protein
VRLILTVDSDCKLCGGTGRAKAFEDMGAKSFYGKPPDGLCPCVEPTQDTAVRLADTAPTDEAHPCGCERGCKMCGGEE